MILTLNIDKNVFPPFWLLSIFQRWILVRVLSFMMLSFPLTRPSNNWSYK
tara:strand:+ start:576 stop:725 length:150 start_codon:yes stop_codon:yes gene_type:complete